MKPFARLQTGTSAGGARNVNSKSVNAYIAAIILFFSQIMATFYFWDLEKGVLLFSLMGLLSIIQFPTFAIIMSFVLCPISSNNIFSCFAEYAFSIYLSKFYVFAIAHSILWYHILTGGQYILFKYSLYILLVYVVLFLSTLLPDLPLIWHLFLFSLEMLFPFVLYMIVDKVLSRVVEVGAKSPKIPPKSPVR